MTTTEERFAGLIAEWSQNSARSLYAAERKIGVSDIGGCREYARRLIADEPFSDDRSDFLPAFVGTGVGELLERAYQSRFPDAVTQMEVTVPLRVGDLEINLPGHPDIVHGNAVYDGKTRAGLAVVRREGGSLQHKFQLTLYARALIEMGILDEEATLALVYYDRSGAEEDPFIVEWTYDPDLLRQAEEWLGDVVYALMHGEEASKDKPRTFCYSYCPYATACRGLDTDVEGLIEDVELVTAMDLYMEAHQRELQAKADKKTAAAALKGVAGHTEKLSLRWITVGESIIPETRRREYERIELKARKLAD